MNCIDEPGSIASEISELCTVVEIAFHAFVHNHYREGGAVGSQLFIVLTNREPERFADPTLDPASSNSAPVSLANAYSNIEWSRLVRVSDIIESQELCFEDLALRSDPSKGLSASKRFQGF